MTKEKWYELYQRSINKYNKKIYELTKYETNAENWYVIKSLWNDCVKEIDEATNVYNMENERK